MIFFLIKKELYRFWQEKRLVFSTIIMPGLLIFIMYQLMGTAMTHQYTRTTTYYKVQYCGEEETFKAVFPDGQMVGEQILQQDIDKAKKLLKKEKLDLLVVIPDDFINKAKVYDVTTKEKAPDIALYYNSTNANSQSAYQHGISLLNVFEKSLSNKFDINAGTEKFDIAQKKEQSGKFLGMMLPFLILVFLYSGCVNIAPDSIAGEKERGILASVLVTPMKRSYIAISKIIALSIICILSAISSSVGTLLSLPKISMGAANIGSKIEYSTLDILLFIFTLLSTALLLVGLICVLSAFAKSVKEAQSYMMPLLLLIMLVGVSGMLQNKNVISIKYAFVPLYNSVQSMVGIFTFHTSLTFCLVSIIVNIIATAICSLVLARLYCSEQVI